MKWFAVIIFMSHQLLAHGVPVTESSLTTARPSMLNTIWFNATRSPDHDNHTCKIEEEYTELVDVVDKIPYEVEVEVWCWSATFKCMETETHYREVKRQENVTRVKTTEVCCDGYTLGADWQSCEPVCSEFCQNGGFCIAPETCQCQHGYEGDYCQHDSLPAGILTGPNVCEKVEEYVEEQHFTENQIVQWEEKGWCWSIPPRCSKMKSKVQPVNKVKHVTKTRDVLVCCDGFMKNSAGNRCIPIEDDQQLQQIVV